MDSKEWKPKTNKHKDQKSSKHMKAIWVEKFKNAVQLNDCYTDFSIVDFFSPQRIRGSKILSCLGHQTGSGRPCSDTFTGVGYFSQISHDLSSSVLGQVKLG